MAVEADDIDRVAIRAGGGEEAVDGDGVKAGEFGGDGIDERVRAGAVQFEGVGGGVLEAADEIGLVGNREEAARDDNAFAIGFDEGGVDAVHGGAGHEADGGGEGHGERLGDGHPGCHPGPGPG